MVVDISFFGKIKKKVNQYTDKKLSGRLQDVVGIDLGTANTLICLNQQGVVLNEASTISYISENGTNSGYLYGNKAKELIGKTPVSIEVVNPVEDGVIASGVLSEEMIRQFLSSVIKKSKLLRPIVIVGVPFSATDVEKKVLQDIVDRCNTQETYLIYESIASAIGAGLPVEKPQGSIVVDIGGGTTEMSLMSMGGIIKNRTFKYGGRKIDNSIVEYIKQKYDVLISNATAEKSKMQIGTVFVKQDEDNKKAIVYGRNLKTNTPTEIVINQEDIMTAIAEFTNIFIDKLNELLEVTPPELMKDVKENGICICGGGAKVENLDFIVKQTTGLDAFVPVEPELCLIRGLERIIADGYQKYTSVLFQQHS